MGTVWSAYDNDAGAVVALKFVKDDAAADPDARRRLVREARAASAVRHPNLVTVYDVAELDDGTPILIMERLEGESLARRLERGRLSLAEATAILLPVVSAVGTAHAHGVVH